MDIRINVGNPTENVRNMVKDFMGNLLTERVSIVVNDGANEDTQSVPIVRTPTASTSASHEVTKSDIREGLNLVETLHHGLRAQGFSSKMPKNASAVIDDVLDEVLAELPNNEYKAICALIETNTFKEASIALQKIQDAIAKNVSGR